MVEDFLNRYCLVRSEKAGVFAGTLLSYSQGEAVVADARRIWYWEGAASLSEMSQRGVSKPELCKFPMPVPKVFLVGVIEIIPCSESAKTSIDGVLEWTNH